jgi:hypothetical protein
MSSSNIAAGEKPKKNKGFFHSVTSYATKAVGTVQNGITTGISRLECMRCLKVLI